MLKGMTSEAALIEECKQGKHSAFEALYTKYASRLMAIALRYCTTTFEAEDLVQETFILVFQKIKLFEGKGSFEGWLKTVLVRTAINNFHKTKHERHQEDSANYEDHALDHETVLSKLSNDELLRVVRTLPCGYRTVFNLYVIEGYTHKEIGALCGITEGTSKSQFSKAKAMLKALLLKEHYISQ